VPHLYVVCVGKLGDQRDGHRRAADHGAAHRRETQAVLLDMLQ
jgi:hypothetical protein